MIPEDHTIDEKILFGILDKDRDGVFSFDDFARNFPKYDSGEVDDFINTEKKRLQSNSRYVKKSEDSDPFDGESSVSISSIDSDQEAKDREFF